MIIEDTRQQAGQHDHIAAWMAAHGVEFAQRGEALPYGDYVRPGANVVVDTKASIDELASNLGREHRRFAAECDRARADGCRLVILIEAGARWGDPEALAKWESWACRRCRWCVPRYSRGRCRRYKRQPMTGPRLLAIMSKMSRAHGVKFEFCDAADTARRICELLGEEVDDGGSV